MLFYEYKLQIVMENFQDEEAERMERAKHMERKLLERRKQEPIFWSAVSGISRYKSESNAGYNLELVMVLDHRQMLFDKVEDFLTKIVRDCFGSDQVYFRKEEITFEAAQNHMENRRGISRDLEHLVKYSDNIVTWECDEHLLNKEKLSKTAALAKAKELMLDNSVLEELKRIYSSKNSKVFLGHPVHYIIKANSKRAAGRIIKLLLQALYSNHRLVSSRFSMLTEMRPNWDQDSLNYFHSQGGATVVMETNGSGDSITNFANAYEEVVDGFDKAFRSYGSQVLFIGVEISRTPGFGRSLQQALEQSGRFIVLEEGCGNLKQVKQLFKKLVEANQLTAQLKKVPLDLPEDKTVYNLSEVYTLFQEWQQKAVNSAYQAYAPVKQVKLKNNEEDSKGFAYKKLQKLVGLKRIKELVDQLLAVHRLNRQRRRMEMGTVDTSRHMLFTGNPGSAKTTVARLLTKVMFEEQLLNNGNIVECGRGDLVGKYVGWTAKQVQKKFREARGGILFIDEAYSLVDDSGSFGDEAINTIVQEMENHRDDVLVIFAGYPDKMKEFLDKNEGLRSRIAFHLDFPDYEAEELLQILELQAEEKGLSLDASAKRKAMNIFKEAVKCKDYGNGRFVRNLLEKAFLKQALRLTATVGTEVLEPVDLNQLIGEDFEVEALAGLEANKISRVGFGVE